MRSLAFCRKTSGYLPNHGRDEQWQNLWVQYYPKYLFGLICPNWPKHLWYYWKKPFTKGVRSPWWQTMKLQCIITQQSGRKVQKSGGGGGLLKGKCFASKGQFYLESRFESFYLNQKNKKKLLYFCPSSLKWAKSKIKKQMQIIILSFNPLIFQG